MGRALRGLAGLVVCAAVAAPARARAEDGADEEPDPCRLAAEGHFRTSGFECAVLVLGAGAPVVLSSEGVRELECAVYAPAESALASAWIDDFVLSAGRAREVTPRGDCPSLWWRVEYRASAGGVDLEEHRRRERLEALDGATPATIFSLYESGHRGAMQAGAQGLESVLAETAQILGQIVADRAAQQAYRLIARRLRTWLGCEPGGGAQPAIFPSTCSLLRDARLQEVLGGPDLLWAAVVADAAALAGTVLRTLASAAGQPPELERLLADLLDGLVLDVLVPSLSGQAAPAAPALARTLPEQIVRVAVDAGPDAPSPPAGVPEDARRRRARARAALRIAAAAVRRCQLLDSPDSPAPRCELGAAVAAIAPEGLPEAEVAAARVAALPLAALLLAAITAPPKDAQAQIGIAVDAVVEAACLYADGCAAGPSGAATPSGLGPVLSALRPFLQAVARQDQDAAVAAIATALPTLVSLIPDVSMDEAQRGRLRRALGIVTTIVQYAGTYRETDDDEDEEAAHEARTALLESLVDDFNDRSSRGGDWIASFGGSLRLAGGARFYSGGEAFYGPVSLTLGAAITYVPGPIGSCPGFHLEIGVLDLGDYLSFEDGLQVREPEIPAAVSPSLTLAATWGTNLPFFLGVEVSYSPTYGSNDEDLAAWGALNVAAVAGIYVPFIDLN